MTSPAFIRATTPMFGRRRHVPTPAECNMSQHEMMVLCTQLLTERRQIMKLRSDLNALVTSVEILSNTMETHAVRFEQLVNAFMRFQGKVGLAVPETAEMATRHTARTASPVLFEAAEKQEVISAFAGIPVDDPIEEYSDA